MTTNRSLAASPMIEALHASAPAADRAAAMLLYGQFVGSWRGRLIYVDRDGARQETSAEAHFGWVLEGRAVQDVWIAPTRAAVQAGAAQVMYGSTLRVYDPGARVWHITWIDPVRQVYNRMTGRTDGAGILQEYTAEDGTQVQWMFSDITPRSFHWTARERRGTGWQVRGEFFFERVA